MAHGYRRLQQWNQWLSQEPLGINLLNTEANILTELSDRQLGKQALVIGVPQQIQILDTIKIPCHSLVTPLYSQKPNAVGFIEGDLHELPITTGSIDLVVLPHTLEFIDTPRKLLAESCRIVKPEGLIAIFGLNPYSAWGLRKLFKSKTAPWNANTLRPHKVKHWLRLADFQMENQKSFMFRPPVKKQNIYKKLSFLETIGHKFFPAFGGVYVLLARAKVIPLTPIKLKWKQQLSDIRISTSISGHIAR